MKKLLVFPDANDDQLYRLTDKLHNMKEDDTMVISTLPTIINIDNAEVMSRKYVVQYCKDHNITIKEP